MQPKTDCLVDQPKGKYPYLAFGGMGNWAGAWGMCQHFRLEARWVFRAFLGLLVSAHLRQVPFWTLLQTPSLVQSWQKHESFVMLSTGSDAFAKDEGLCAVQQQQHKKKSKTWMNFCNLRYFCAGWLLRRALPWGC